MYSTEFHISAQAKLEEGHVALVVATLLPRFGTCVMSPLNAPVLTMMRTQQTDYSSHHDLLHRLENNEAARARETGPAL
eukprot:scaffold1727_cov133-Cylindrotheca_fusiformis.AAC.14